MGLFQSVLISWCVPIGEISLLSLCNQWWNFTLSLVCPNFLNLLFLLKYFIFGPPNSSPVSIPSLSLVSESFRKNLRKSIETCGMDTFYSTNLLSSVHDVVYKGEDEEDVHAEG